MKETLEEAACIALGYDYKNWVNIHSKDTSTKVYLEVAFWCNGAKWHAERSYSEEEVLVLLHKRDAYNFEANTKSLSEWKTPKEWFKQTKKK